MCQTTAAAVEKAGLDKEVGDLKYIISVDPQPFDVGFTSYCDMIMDSLLSDNVCNISWATSQRYIAKLIAKASKRTKLADNLNVQ